MGATGRDLHIDTSLSEMAIGYRPEGFIADMIFPIVNVSKQSDRYVIWSRSDRLRRPDTRRAPGVPANTIVENVSSGTYYASNYALKTSVVVEDFANADPVYLDNLNTGKTQLVLDGLLLDWEVRVASQVTNTANVGTSTAVASAWTDATNSDPLGDLNTMIDNVHYSTGLKPNRIVFGLQSWKPFRRHDNVRNLIYGNNNGGGYASVQAVADLLEVDEISIGGAFQNTGAEGQAEALSTIWGDHVLVYFAPAQPTRERPSFGYAFRWVNGNLPNMQVERHPYDTRLKAQEIEAGYYQDEVVTGAEYGGLITNVTSST